MLAKRIMVNVKRNPMEGVAKIVYEHEVPLLNIIHGDGSVLLVTQKPEGIGADQLALLEKPEKIDPHQEWSRLISVYGKHPEYNLPVVEYFYQNRKQNLVNFKLQDYLADASNDAGPAEVVEDPHPATQETQTTDDTEELKRRCKVLGVSLQGVSKRDTIEEKLRTAIEERLELLGVEFSSDDSTESIWQKLPPMPVSS